MQKSLVTLCGAVLLGLCACGTSNSPAAIQSTSTSPATAAAQSTSTPRATATARPPTATPRSQSWQTIQHFAGSQNGQTATFHVPDGGKIVWSATATDQYGGDFSIMSYNSDGSYGDLVANTGVTATQSGTYVVHGDLDIYLKIDALSCNYDIAVEVYR